MIESLFAGRTYVTSKTLMDVTADRHRVLAGNLANVHTPGFKRVDMSTSFVERLSSAIASGDTKQISRINQPDFENVKGLAAQSADGNNVSVETEMMLIAKNAMEYEANAEFLSNSLRRLKTAITGRNT